MATFPTGGTAASVVHLPDVLWYELKRRNLRYTFKRQCNIDYMFVVEFYCPELKLVVDVVDAPHDYAAEKESWLLSYGCTLLYFTPLEVLDNRDEVVNKIFRVCLHLSSSV